MPRGILGDRDPALIDVCRERLSYDPTTGVFVWLQPRPGRLKSPYGRAGTQAPIGYRGIRIDGLRIPEHHLAFALMTGEWPDRSVDHINGIKSDNRFSNLRLVTISQNGLHQINARGYTKHQGKYVARVILHGKEYYLGRYTTKEEAASVYARARDDLYLNTFGQPRMGSLNG